MRGFVLAKPHGDMVLEGQKTIVLRGGDFPELTQGPVALVQGHVALGEVMLSAPVKFTPDDLESTKSQHRVSDNERKRWWSGSTNLWGYAVQVVKVYGKPQPVFRERDTLDFIPEVVIKDQRTYGLLKVMFGKAVADYSADEVALVHRLLHVFFQRKLQGERVVIEGKPRTSEDMASRHAVLVKELKARGIDHQVDEATEAAKTINELSALYENHQEAGGVQEAKPIMLQRGAVCFSSSGDAVSTGLPAVEEIQRRIKFRVKRTLPGQGIMFTADGAGGISKYDLALVPSDGSIVQPGRLDVTDDPYMVTPPEGGKYEHVVQHHYRGKTAHADLRLEGPDDMLIGWTLADLQPGKIDEPVLTLEKGLEHDGDADNWGMDYTAGQLRERTTKDGKLVAGQLRAFRTMRHPSEWLDVEGATPPWPVPGSDKEYPGVFTVLAKGLVEYGAQKTDLHEYYLDGALGGRLVLRCIERDEFTKSHPESKPDNHLVEARAIFWENYLDDFQKIWRNDISSSNFWLKLPGELKAKRKRIEAEAPLLFSALERGAEKVMDQPGKYWVATRPQDPTPVVLTRAQVKSQWVPPVGISALPQAMKNKIPDKYKYWTKSTQDEARQVRDALVAAGVDRYIS